MDRPSSHACTESWELSSIIVVYWTCHYDKTSQNYGHCNTISV